MVVAIDGPAGAGKSTVARALARQLGFAYLDTGAMYRCVALLALRSPGTDLAALAREAQIGLGGANDAEQHVRLDGRDVTQEIRAPEVSETASRVAADPEVRAALVAKQRALLALGDWVAEGRDVGTVVAPEAELKIFLSADSAERARRRALQSGGDPRATLAAQELRDRRDATRAHSPLRVAADAVELDTSGLGVEEVVGRLAALAKRAAAAPRGREEP